jgi:hypothetical protein
VILPRGAPTVCPQPLKSDIRWTKGSGVWSILLFACGSATMALAAADELSSSRRSAVLLAVVAAGMAYVLVHDLRQQAHRETDSAWTGRDTGIVSLLGGCASLMLAASCVDYLRPLERLATFVITLIFALLAANYVLLRRRFTGQRGGAQTV